MGRRESTLPDPDVVRWEERHPFNLTWILAPGFFGCGPFRAYLVGRCHRCQLMTQYGVRLPGTRLDTSWRDRAARAEQAIHDKIAAHPAWRHCPHVGAGMRPNREALKPLVPRPIS